ncbi:MAG: glutathione S-transferase [Pseudomonadota bacterium]
MTYDLYIGDRSFSSWSLRGWLMLKAFDLPHRTHLVGLYSGTMADDLADLAPARLVPVLKTPEGDVSQDTLAMAETLHERHPDAGLWPRDQSARVLARWIVAEMHSGFGALRGECPMNLRDSWVGFPVSDAVRTDLARIETLWSEARSKFGSGGPWLFGTYSLADVFYAPVAARIAGYDLPVSDAAQNYVAAHLADPLFRQWRAMGATVDYDPMPYQHDLQKRNWPGPTPITARAVDSGPSVNETCPYSGEPITDFLEAGGKIYGFCNAFCRDKTVQDPEAWPDFMAIYQS